MVFRRLGACHPMVFSRTRGVLPKGKQLANQYTLVYHPTADYESNAVIGFPSRLILTGRPSEVVISRAGSSPRQV